jgi:hypothetical protein
MRILMKVPMKMKAPTIMKIKVPTIRKMKSNDNEDESSDER